MFQRLKRSLDQLKHDEPGRRFRNRCDAMRRDGGPGFWGRIGLYASAILCILIGIVLVFIPGPAVLFFFLAGGLLATESPVIARWMDKLELLVRRVWNTIRRRWRRLRGHRA